MDEKTEELRDIFMSVTDDDRVTERQEEPPGTLTGSQSVDDRLIALIERMRSQFDFQTSLDNDALRNVAKAFYRGDADGDIAGELETDEDTVRRARLDLHLVRESDRDAPFPFEEFTRATAEEVDPTTLRERFEAPTDVIDRCLLVVDAEREMRRANYRYRDQFDELLGDADVAEHMTSEVTDDGLEDATEGLEVNTSF